MIVVVDRDLVPATGVIDAAQDHAIEGPDHVIVDQNHVDDRIVVSDREVALDHVANHVSDVIRKRLKHDHNQETIQGHQSEKENKEVAHAIVATTHPMMSVDHQRRRRNVKSHAIETAAKARKIRIVEIDRVLVLINVSVVIVASVEEGNGNEMI